MKRIHQSCLIHNENQIKNFGEFASAIYSIPKKIFALLKRNRFDTDVIRANQFRDLGD